MLPYSGLPESEIKGDKYWRVVFVSKLSRASDDQSIARQVSAEPSSMRATQLRCSS